MNPQSAARMEHNLENQGKQTDMTVFKDSTQGYFIKVNPVRLPPPKARRTDYSRYNLPGKGKINPSSGPASVASSAQLDLCQNTREARPSLPPPYPGCWPANSRTSVNSHAGSSVQMSTPQNPNWAQSSSVPPRSNFAADRYDGNCVENPLTNSNVEMVNNFVANGNQSYVTPATVVQDAGDFTLGTTDYLLMDLDQTTNHSSQEAVPVDQTPVTMVTSGYHPPVTSVSSEYHPSFTVGSSEYHPPVTMVSSEYHPSATVVSSGYHPPVTMVSQAYHPPGTMVSSEYTQSSNIPNGYHQMASTGSQQGHGVPYKDAAAARMSVISTTNSRIMQTKVCQNNPVLQTVTQVQTNRQTIQYQDTGKSEIVPAQENEWSPITEISGPYCDCQVQEYSADWMKAVSYKSQGHDAFMTNASSVVINKQQVYTFNKNENLLVSVGELRFKNILPKGFRYLLRYEDDVSILELKELEFLMQKNALISRKIRRCISLHHLRLILKSCLANDPSVLEPWFELTLGHNCPKVALLIGSNVFVCPVCRHVEPWQYGDKIHGKKCSNCSYLERNHKIVVPIALVQNLQEDGVPIGYLEVEGKKICAYKYQGQTYVSCRHLLRFLSGFPWINFVNLAESLKVTCVPAPKSVVLRFLEHYPAEVVGVSCWCTLSQLRCIACFSVGQMNNTEFLLQNQVLSLIAQGQYTEVFEEPQQKAPPSQYKKQVVYVTSSTLMPAGRYVVFEREDYIDIIREDGTVYRLCRKDKKRLEGQQKPDVNDILSIAAKEIMSNAAENSECPQDGIVCSNTNMSNVSSDAQTGHENSHVNTDVNQTADTVEVVQTMNNLSISHLQGPSPSPQSTNPKLNSEQSTSLSIDSELLSMPNGFFESMPPNIPQLTKQKKHFLSPSKVGKAPKTKLDVIVIQNENGVTYECTPLGLAEEFEKNGFCFNSSSPAQKLIDSALQEAPEPSVDRQTSTCPSLDSGISEEMELANTSSGSEGTLTVESQTASGETAGEDAVVHNSIEAFGKQYQGQPTLNDVEKHLLPPEQNQERSASVTCSMKDPVALNEQYNISGYEQNPDHSDLKSKDNSLKMTDEQPTTENQKSFHWPVDSANDSLDSSVSFPRISSPQSTDCSGQEGGKEKTHNLSILASVAEEASPFSVETLVDEESVCSSLSMEHEDLSGAADKFQQEDSAVIPALDSKSLLGLVERENQLEQDMFERSERNVDCSSEVVSDEPDTGCIQEQCLTNVKPSGELNSSQPVQEISRVEQDNMVELAIDELTIGEPTIGEPSIDEATIGEPSIGEPTIGEPTIDEPSIGGPTIGEHSIGEPTIDEPSIGGPTIGEPTIGGPPTSEPPLLEDSGTETSKEIPSKQQDIENLEELRNICVELDQPEVQAALPVEKDLGSEEAVTSSIDKPGPCLSGNNLHTVVHQEKLSVCEEAAESFHDLDLTLSASDDELPQKESVKNDVKTSPDLMKKAWLKLTMDLSEHSSEEETDPKKEKDKTQRKSDSIFSEVVPCADVDIERHSPIANYSPQHEEPLTENMSVQVQKSSIPNREVDIPRLQNSEDDIFKDRESENFDQLSMKLQDMIDQQREKHVKRNAELTAPSIIKDSMVDSTCSKPKHERKKKIETEDLMTKSKSLSSQSEKCKKKVRSNRNKEAKELMTRSKSSSHSSPKRSNIKLMIRRGRCVSMVDENSKTETKDVESNNSEDDKTINFANPNQKPDKNSHGIKKSSKKHHKTNKRKRSHSVHRSKKRKMSECSTDCVVTETLNDPDNAVHKSNNAHSAGSSKEMKSNLQHTEAEQISGNRNDLEPMDSENTSEVVASIEHTESDVHHQSQSKKSESDEHFGISSDGKDLDMAEVSEVTFTSDKQEYAVIIDKRTKDQESDKIPRVIKDLDMSSCSGNVESSPTGNGDERTIDSKTAQRDVTEMMVDTDPWNTKNERSDYLKNTHEKNREKDVKHSPNETGDTGMSSRNSTNETSEDSKNINEITKGFAKRDCARHSTNETGDSETKSGNSPNETSEDSKNTHEQNKEKDVKQSTNQTGNTGTKSGNTTNERSEDSKNINERPKGFAKRGGVKQRSQRGPVKRRKLRTREGPNPSESTNERIKDSVPVEGDSEKGWWSQLEPGDRLAGILDRVVIQRARERGGHLDLQLQVDPSIYQVFGQDEDKTRCLHEKLHQLARIAYLRKRSQLTSKQENGLDKTLSDGGSKPNCSDESQTLNSYPRNGSDKTLHPPDGNSTTNCSDRSRTLNSDPGENRTQLNLDEAIAVETDNSVEKNTKTVVLSKERKKRHNSSTKSKPNDISQPKNRKLNPCSSPSRKINVRPLHAGSTSATSDPTGNNGGCQTIEVTVLYDSNSVNS